MTAADARLNAAVMLAVTRSWNESGYQFDAAIPVQPGDVEPTGNIKAGLSPAGRAVRLVHIGPYEQTLSSYEKLFAWMAAHGLSEGRLSWEHYISDPGETPADEIITHIYFLIGDDE